MKRNHFGSWGLDLSAGEFAAALAALGAYQHPSSGAAPAPETISNITADDIFRRLTSFAESPFVGWALDAVPPEMLDSLKAGPTARSFAEAWGRFRAVCRPPLRFELRLRPTDDYFWVAEQLLRPSAGADSLYLRADDPPVEVGWNWPLRVGFLGDAPSANLRHLLEARLRTSLTVRNLVEFVSVRKEGDRCDVLLMPHGLREALSGVLREESAPRADCVLVLGFRRYEPGRTPSLIKALRGQAVTAGVGLLSVGDGRRGEWFYRLMTELSHNNPLDLALFEARRALAMPTPPLLAASRRLMEFSLVSRTAERIGRAMRERLAEAAPPETGPQPPPDGPRARRIPTGHVSSSRGGGGAKGVARGGAKGAVKRMGGGGPPRRPPAKWKGAPKGFTPPKPQTFDLAARDLSERLTRTLPADLWRHESGASTEVAERSRAAGAIMKKIKPAAQDRRIRAQVLDYSSPPRAREVKGPLKHGTNYAVDVWIGPPGKKGVSAPEQFPEENLPPSETGHRLTVVFTEPGASTEPQVGKIFLPPTGESEPCRFFFRTSETAAAVRARIVILHRNRVMQTAILEVGVGAGGRAAGRVELSIEARVTPLAGDLDRRQSFDAALVLNHTPDGRSLATALAGDTARMFSFDEASIRDTIQTLNDQLTELAEDPEGFPKDLAATNTTRLLNTLAREGSHLHKFLFAFRGDPEWPKGKRRVQIVSTRLESNLPLEFLYDYETPREKAKLCKYAVGALPKGECDKACGGPKGRETVICPLGFWGLNRVIERHAFDPQVRVPADFAMTAADAPSRPPLKVLESALFAASEEVDRARKGTIKGIEKVLKQNARRASYAPDWKDWVSRVKRESPSLLMLLSHTEVDDEPRGRPALEISKAQRLSVLDIKEKHVRNPGAKMKAKPLVMLIGCKTNAPDNLLHSFVVPFGAYASIVVSTGATVLALDASKVAVEFVKALAKLPKTGEATFGEVMVDVRRRLLAQGMPMVLCLSAYGDADWRIE